MKVPPIWKPGDITQGLTPNLRWIVAKPNSIPIGDWVAGKVLGSIEIIEDSEPPLTWVREDNPLFLMIKNDEL